MRTPKFSNILLTTLLGGGLWACGDDDPQEVFREDSLLVFSETDSRWVVSQFRSDGQLRVTFAVPMLEARTAQKARETASDDLGPGWGDAVASPDGRRVFVNARNADALVVIDTASGQVERIFEFGWGDRPVHLYNPNHGDEIWTHLDGKGSFFVVNAETLEVLAGLDRLVPGTNPEVGTGHGKLVYAGEQGEKYYATNTAEPAVFAIDGATKSMTATIAVCGTPPVDDPATPRDESLDPPEGGTHDKAFLPGPGLFVFQCTRGAGFAFVDPTGHTVVADKVPMTGSLTASTNGEVVLCINGGVDAEQIQVWEADDTQDNSYQIDWTATVGNGPSARGTHFHRRADDGGWEAWIPQTRGTEVAVLDLETRQTDMISIGRLTMPDGASHFSRRGAIGATAFYTYADAGLVRIDLATRTPRLLGPIEGSTSRMAFARIAE